MSVKAVGKNLVEVVSDTGLLAAYLKAAGDSLRLEVLRILQHNAYSVLELCDVFGVRQPAMSHHLKVLANAGLVATRREGNSIFYRRAPLLDEPLLAELHRTLMEAVDKLAMDKCLATKIHRLHQARSEASLQFFQENAKRFKQNQDLIASFKDYGASVVELLEASIAANGQALEVGPGQGELLAELSSRFRRVLALDNSGGLLDLARDFAAQRRLENIRFKLGSITDADIELPAVDCITLNMVLHHLPEPSRIFGILSGLLNPGGVLLVTDLCHHGQQWVRESCGDLWQGFEPEELNQWAEAAALEEGDSLYLALRNGFRIQIRVYRKPEANPNKQR